jgi:hypothetical protein
MEQTVAKSLKEAYARAVPVRWRALLGAWTGKRRCNSGSQCERQAIALLGIVRQHAERQNAAAASLLLLLNDAPPKVTMGAHASRLDAVVEEEEAEEEERALFKACVALLDQPDLFLTLRRTTALAHETIMETLMRAQQSGARYDEETMRRAVMSLERLEGYIQTRFCGCQPRPGEEEAHALLVHMGRGVEVAEIVARRRQHGRLSL